MQQRPPGVPVIPPPPSRVGRRGATNPRWWIWPSAFAAGIALGFGAYQGLQGLDFYFDYWLALALG
jgi:hypothetical protein